jgi:WD40 repeat protein
MSGVPPWDGDTQPSPQIGRQVEDVCTAFEAAWRAGDRPALGDYLARVLPDVRAPLLRELIGLDIDYRRRAGERPQWEDYGPWLAPACPEWLRDVLAGSAPAASGVAHIGGYEVLGELGRGGMGVVYRARDPRLKRLVALKMIRADGHADPGQRRRFQTEAESAARLRHPNIVQVYEVGEAGGRPYLALEYVDGGSLAQRLAGTPLPVEEAAPLVETLARAVHAAHQAGVVHRDLKPANVLLACSDGGGRPGGAGEEPRYEPKIADFGLAKQLDADTGHTRTGAVVGTPSYMAPEQAWGTAAEVGPPADVYALGAILYECLTGRPPFKGTTALDTLEQVRSRDPVPPSSLRPQLPRDLETVCLKCLHKEPAKRYGSALDLADDLRRFRTGEPIRARPVGRPERFARWCRRNPALAAVGAVALVALTALVGLGVDYALTVARSARELRAFDVRLRGEATRLAFGQARQLIEQDQLGEGLLRLAHALGDAPPDDDLQRLLRTNLAAGGEALVPLHACLAHGEQAMTVAVAPDGRTALTGGADGLARLWDLRTGTPLRDFAHGGVVTTVAFSPDGRTVVTGGRNRQVRRWDVGSGQPLGDPLDHDQAVHVVAFSRDGRFLVTGSGKDISGPGEARVWDARTGAPLPRRLGCDRAVRALAVSADGSTVVTGGEDGFVRLWRVNSGSADRQWKLASDAWVYLVALSPDGGTVAAGSRDEYVQLWDTGSAQPLPTLTHGAPVRALLFAADGQALLTGTGQGTGSGEVQAWQPRTGRPAEMPRRLAGPVRTLGLAQDGRTVWAASLRGPSVRLWQLAAEPVVPPVLAHQGEVVTAAFSRDGTHVLTVEGSTASDRGAAHVWGPAADRPVRSIPLTPVPWGAAWDPDGRRLLTWKDRTVWLWDTAEASPQPRTLLEAPEWLDTLGFSPDGQLCLTGGEEGKARAWDLASGRPPLELSHRSPVYATACSRDGRTVLTACLDGTVRLWDLAARQPRGPVLLHPEAVRGVALAPGEDVVATGCTDGNARLWDAAGGRLLRNVLAHPAPIQALAFDPAGGRLLTGCAATPRHTGLARLWDVRTGLPLGPPLPLPGGVRAVAFRPDGGGYLTAGVDGKVRLWRAPVPWPGDAGDATRWVQALTGLTLGADDSLQVLSADDWRACRRAGDRPGEPE